MVVIEDTRKDTRCNENFILVELAEWSTFKGLKIVKNVSVTRWWSMKSNARVDERMETKSFIMFLVERDTRPLLITRNSDKATRNTYDFLAAATMDRPALGRC